MSGDSDAAFEFLRASYRELRAYSRTDAIRIAQRSSGHAPCFGRAFKDRTLPSPRSCGELQCPYRDACLGLHDRPLAGARIREDSVEILSRTFLAARSFERRGRTLSAYQTDVASLFRSWQEDTPQVAFLGAFSSGKSTLINRVIGRELLPHARTPTTAVLTSVAYGRTAEADIAFRDTVEIAVLTEQGQATDTDAVNALLTWLESAREYRVSSVEVLGADGVPRALRLADAIQRLRRVRAEPRVTESLRSGSLAMARRVLAGARRAIDPGDENVSSVLFRIGFEFREPLRLDLGQPAEMARLADLLTNPTHALAVRRARCRLPVEALTGMQLLDTAGLCSPVAFHTEVTAELLERRPDKVVVLLDSRRLDDSNNRKALAALSRFVEEPEDYRRVTFALTFWDNALRTYMLEDFEESPRDFGDASERQRSAEELGARRRRTLRRLLEDVTGVASPVEPSIFLLGLGANAPPEMSGQLQHFQAHLQEGTAGWVGVDMWSERWRAGRPLLEQLLDVHAQATDEVRAAIDLANSSARVEDERERLHAAREALAEALKGATSGLKRTLHDHAEAMRLEVARLDSQKDILRYLEDGYFRAANAVLDALQGESERHRASIRELTSHAGGLRVVSIDRRLLGVSAWTKNRATGEVTGIGYAMQSLWDLFFSGIHEATADDRGAARALIVSETRGTFSIIERAVVEWCATAARCCANADEGLEEQLEHLDARRRDVVAHVAALRRKAEHLERARPHADRLLADAERTIRGVEQAQRRAEIGGHASARARADVSGRWCELRKGREADEWVLFDIPGGELAVVDLAAGAESLHFVPTRVRGAMVDFAEVGAAPAPRSRPVPVPEGARRLVLHVSTLRGRFYFDRARPVGGGARRAQ